MIKKIKGLAFLLLLLSGCNNAQNKKTDKAKIELNNSSFFEVYYDSSFERSSLNKTFNLFKLNLVDYSINHLEDVTLNSQSIFLIDDNLDSKIKSLEKDKKYYLIGNLDFYYIGEDEFQGVSTNSNIYLFKEDTEISLIYSNIENNLETFASKKELIDSISDLKLLSQNPIEFNYSDFKKDCNSRNISMEDYEISEADVFTNTCFSKIKFKHLEINYLDEYKYEFSYSFVVLNNLVSASEMLVNESNYDYKITFSFKKDVNLDFYRVLGKKLKGDFEHNKTFYCIFRINLKDVKNKIYYDPSFKMIFNYKNEKLEKSVNNFFNYSYSNQFAFNGLTEEKAINLYKAKALKYNEVYGYGE